MATKNVEAQAHAAPPKNKKKLFIVIGAVLVLALGGGIAFMISGKKHASSAEKQNAEPAAEHEPEPPKETVHLDPKAAPVYMPLDSMVVNLADPGGERVAQVGIVFELSDAHAADTVKAYLPTIRSSILMLLSQRTADELLSAEGKQKLIDDILREAAVPFGGGDDDSESDNPKKKKKRKRAVVYPVTGVLFSSIVVQ